VTACQLWTDTHDLWLSAGHSYVGSGTEVEDLQIDRRLSLAFGDAAMMTGFPFSVECLTSYSIILGSVLLLLQQRNRECLQPYKVVEREVA
jgi:hypothetical protein